MGAMKPVRGAKVRLLHDIQTRGGKKFRAGLIMQVGDTDGKYTLSVRVRAKNHWVILNKNEYPRAFTVVSLPKEEES